jgi:flagellar protein FlaG
MLIQNLTGNSVPAPTANYGNSGSPVVAVSVAQTGSVPAESTQTAQPPVPGTPLQGQPTAPPSNAQIQSAVDKVNQAMLQGNTGVEFSIDNNSMKTVIKVVDTQTGNTIKQFPSEQMIAISKSIDQFQKGLLITQKA